MATEDQIRWRFEAELAAIARLDRSYYMTPCPTRAERSDYAARQDRLEKVRTSFYAELASLREKDLWPFRPCRYFIRRSRP